MRKLFDGARNKILQDADPGPIHVSHRATGQFADKSHSHLRALTMPDYLEEDHFLEWWMYARHPKKGYFLNKHSQGT